MATAIAIIFICIAAIVITAIVKGVRVVVPPKNGSITVQVGGKK